MTSYRISGLSHLACACSFLGLVQPASAQLGTTEPVHNYAHSTADIRDVLMPGEDTALLIIGDSHSGTFISNRLPSAIWRSWPMDWVGWRVSYWGWPHMQIYSHMDVVTDPIWNLDILLDNAPAHEMPYIAEVQFQQDVLPGTGMIWGKLLDSLTSDTVLGDWVYDKPVGGHLVVYVNDTAPLPTVPRVAARMMRGSYVPAIHEQELSGIGIQRVPADSHWVLPADTAYPQMCIYAPANPDINEQGMALAYVGAFYYLLDPEDLQQTVPGKVLETLSHSGFKACDHAYEQTEGDIRGYSDESLVQYLDAMGTADRENALCILHLGQNDVKWESTPTEQFRIDMEHVIERYDFFLAQRGVQNRRYILALGWNIPQIVHPENCDPYRQTMFDIASEGTPGHAGRPAVDGTRIAAVSQYHYYSGVWHSELFDDGGSHPATADDADTLMLDLWEAIQANPACPGDIDHSNDVGTADFFALLQSWGPCTGLCHADMNMDGFVDTADFFATLQNWGACD
jgi:hypothetical protein